MCFQNLHYTNDIIFLYLAALVNDLFCVGSLQTATSSVHLDCWCPTPTTCFDLIWPYQVDIKLLHCIVSLVCCFKRSSFVVFEVHSLHAVLFCEHTTEYNDIRLIA
jgi:hypothetical protein